MAYSFWVFFLCIGLILIKVFFDPRVTQKVGCSCASRFVEPSSLAIVRESRKMDAGRQRASNDRVLDRDLIANRNSSARHKKGSVAENKRLFRSRESIRIRAIVRLPRERRARVQSTRVQPDTAYSRRGLTRSCRCNRSAGGISNHERAPVRQISTRR